MDALEHSKIRQASASKDKRRNVKHTLQVADLTNALNERGITVKKPEFYQ